MSEPTRNQPDNRGRLIITRGFGEAFILRLDEGAPRQLLASELFRHPICVRATRGGPRQIRMMIEADLRISIRREEIDGAQQQKSRQPSPHRAHHHDEINRARAFMAAAAKLLDGPVYRRIMEAATGR